MRQFRQLAAPMRCVSQTFSNQLTHSRKNDTTVNWMVSLRILFRCMKSLLSMGLVQFMQEDGGSWMMKPWYRGINMIQNRKNDANLLPLASSFCKNAIFVSIPNLLYSNRFLPVHRFRFLFRLFLYPRRHWLPLSLLFSSRLHPDWLPQYQQ